MAKVVMKAVKMWNMRFCWTESAGKALVLNEECVCTYDGNTESHCVESNRGDHHEHEDNPMICQYHRNSLMNACSP